MKCLLFLVFLVAFAYSQSSTSSPSDKEESGVKKEEADGHRHRHRYYGPRPYTAPIIDRNVCDLDASVLLVVEGGRHGRNRARRVKCSDVAAADEDSCMVCCQNAARRDPAIKNEDIYGFLTAIDHFTKDGSWESGSNEDDYSRREKRAAKEEVKNQKEDATTQTSGNAEYEREDSKEHHHDHELESFEPLRNYKNLRCLCCAPRRPLPPPPPMPIPVLPAPQPSYGSYQGYAQQSSHPSGYSQPSPSYSSYPQQSAPYPASAPTTYN